MLWISLSRRGLCWDSGEGWQYQLTAVVYSDVSILLRTVLISYGTYVLANPVSNAYDALEILPCEQTEAK